jgi:predicted CopG family antitoxin
MKSILIHLEDEEYETLKKAKGNLSWKQVLLAFQREEDRKSGMSKLKNPETSKSGR